MNTTVVDLFKVSLTVTAGLKVGAIERGTENVSKLVSIAYRLYHFAFLYHFVFLHHFVSFCFFQGAHHVFIRSQSLNALLRDCHRQRARATW